MKRKYLMAITLHMAFIDFSREKQYKEIFGAWGWRKNLPSEYAQWMARKAEKRKREDDKDTIFHWKGNQWNGADAEKRAARSRKSAPSAESIGKTLMKTL